MKNIVGVRREDLSKKGEKRTAIVPDLVNELTNDGIELIVQPRTNPFNGELKRAFEDQEYETAGAKIAEDISAAKLIFGLKEIETAHILPEKAYAFFSHTHKGQIKNRQMLETLVTGKNTVLDFELMTNAQNARVITAFTYFAGYAGMIDTIWAYGQRIKRRNIVHPFQQIPQSVETEDLGKIKRMLADLAVEIKEKGTPEALPPMIVAFLGNGKTSTGGQEIYDILGGEAIAPWDVKYIHQKGSRDRVYKVVLDIQDMYRLKKNAPIDVHEYRAMSIPDQQKLYFTQPQHFESNLDQYLPYISILMNCILWSPKYPRVLTNEMMADFYPSSPLVAIGDISCDPNGGIEFSRETWIDNPVFMFNPEDESTSAGFDGEGVLLMGVTNLPCEFSADASAQFSENLRPYIRRMANADYDAPLAESGLPAEIQKSVILWNGEFTPAYSYMQEFLVREEKA